MILAVMKAIYAIAYKKIWTIQDFNGVWTHDLAIPVRRSNQLSLMKPGSLQAVDLVQNADSE